MPLPARLLAACVAAACAVTGLAACGGDGDVLTIYSGRQKDLVGPLLEQFADEENVDIEVKYARLRGPRRAHRHRR